MKSEQHAIGLIVQEQGTLATAEDRATELRGPFAHRRGVGWMAELPGEHQATSTQRRESLTLREDGRRLGPSNAMDADICALGGGRYAIWPELICFSASDNGDPNFNGRLYTLTPPDPPKMTHGVFHVAPTMSPPWRAPGQALRCAVIGVGARGRDFAQRLWALDGVELAWLADPSQERLEACRDELAMASVKLTTEAERAIVDPGVHAVFIAAPDYLHKLLATAAFAAGKDVFLEKPVATSLADAWEIMDAWRNNDRVLQLGYVLRETPFYRAARQVVVEGRLGRVHTVQMTDCLGVAHGASYMRRWHRRAFNSGGLMVHKGCHDLDLVCWLLDTQPTRVASFGGARAFSRSAPAPFCSQCPERVTCPYEDQGAYEARTSAQRADPTAFGLDTCVFTDDKDIVDNQTVAFELANGARGSFALAMQNPHGSQRTLSILGDNGRLDGIFETGGFEVFTNDGAPSFAWSVDTAQAEGHGGGDQRTIISFLDACLGRRPPEMSSTRDAIRGVVFALAAEEAMRLGTVVSVNRNLNALD